MAKRFKFDQSVKRVERLNKDRLSDLLYDLILAFQIIEDSEEMTLFVQDLLTKKEAKRLAKRLKIAELLLAGFTYEEIETELHTSHGTVAKVASWLKEKGKGFKLVVKKLDKKRHEEHEMLASKAVSLKKRIRMYGDPDSLVAREVEKSETEDRKKMKELFSNLEKKRNLYRKIDKLAREYYKKEE